MTGTGIEVVENKLYNVEEKEVLGNGDKNNRYTYLLWGKLERECVVIRGHEL